MLRAVPYPLTEFPMKKAILLAMTLAFGLGAATAEAATKHQPAKKAVHAKHVKATKAHAKRHH